jgi:hypothetical protein
VWFLREGLQLYSMLIVAGEGLGAGVIRSDPQRVYITSLFLLFTPRGFSELIQTGGARDVWHPKIYALSQVTVSDDLFCSQVLCCLESKIGAHFKK